MSPLHHAAPLVDPFSTSHFQWTYPPHNPIEALAQVCQTYIIGKVPDQLLSSPVFASYLSDALQRSAIVVFNLGVSLGIAVWLLHLASGLAIDTINAFTKTFLPQMKCVAVVVGRPQEIKMIRSYFYEDTKRRRITIAAVYDASGGETGIKPPDTILTLTQGIAPEPVGV